MLIKRTITPYSYFILPGLFLAMIIAIIASFVASPQQSSAAPFADCNTNGLLYQYPNGTDTTVYSIDMVTGQSDPSSTPTPTPQISGRTINAIGYNVTDNFVYGWDNTNDTLVRIHSDFTVEEITINGFTTATTIIIGDVDENGYYWFVVGNGTANGETYHAVDLTSGGNTVDLVPGIGTGTLSGIPAGQSAGADWAYVPGGSGLYRVMHDTPNNQGRLLVFDRDTGAFSDLGLIDQSQLPSTDLKEGAFYADANGFLYASDNDDGNIYRIDVNAVSATLFSTGPASDANDGARCAEAIIPIDFGDAPDGYDTLLASDGARHGIASFNEAASTAPLMLGKKIDIETDGFPEAEAHGDDDNHPATPFVNDEDSVQHIVVTPGTPTTLSIPVTVTNNTSDIATLAGWIDLDSNSAFDVGERVTLSIPANSGTAVYELDFPETTFATDTYARLRLFDPTVADPQPTGSATGGEVEDYLVQVGTYEVEKTSSPTSGTVVAPNDTITYSLTITNTGLTDLINLTIHDNLTDVLDDAALVGSPIVEPASAGTATIDSTGLEFAFTGDVLAGQSVTVTYEVKINDLGSLGNSQVNNMVIATHSNCHPVVTNGQVAAADDGHCQTSHPIGTSTLANTGSNMLLPILLAGSSITLSGALYLGQKQLAKQKNR
jgi:fimbrial isopeptide formation D2 family protein